MRNVWTAAVAGLVSLGVFGGASAYAQRDSQRPSKQAGISLQLATNTAAEGFRQLQLDDGRFMYLVPNGSFSVRDVSSASVADGNVKLTLTHGAAERMANLMGGRGANHIVVSIDGQLVGAGSVALDASTANATITGLGAERAARLGKRLVGTPVPAGPRIQILPEQVSIQPGEAATVEAFVSEVSDLRGYQVQLQLLSGASGQISVEDVWIDAQHPQYVFAGLQKLDAVDHSSDRALGVLVDSSVNVPTSAYLLSFVLRASPDASGTFGATILVADRESMLVTPDGGLIEFAVGPASAINVGSSVAPRPVPRD